MLNASASSSGSSGAWIAILFWIWLLPAILSSFYFWAKKTDRSQSPIQRRMVALGYGLAWPVLLIRAIVSRNQSAAQATDRAAAESRILGDSAPTTPPATPRPNTQGNKIANPFD